MSVSGGDRGVSLYVKDAQQKWWGSSTNHGRRIEDSSSWYCRVVRTRDVSTMTTESTTTGANAWLLYNVAAIPASSFRNNLILRTARTTFQSLAKAPGIEQSNTNTAYSRVRAAPLFFFFFFVARGNIRGAAHTQIKNVVLTRVLNALPNAKRF